MRSDRHASARGRRLGPCAAACFALVLLAAPTRAETLRFAQAAPSGEAAYAEACASCHRTPGRFMRRYADMPAEQRARALDAFLVDHYAPDPGRRAAIVAWLMAWSAR